MCRVVLLVHDIQVCLVLGQGFPLLLFFSFSLFLMSIAGLGTTAA